VKAAGKMGGDEATALLATVAITDKSKKARHEAARTLAGMAGAANGIALFTHEMGVGDKKQRKAAAEALKIMTSARS
jgi:HEAT repeat protein